MKITAIAPWFGGKRTMAQDIIAQLGPHSVYWEPFCGGMSIILVKPRCALETVGDLHGDLTNLALVLQDVIKAPILYDRLQQTLYSDELFKAAKLRFLEGQDRAKRRLGTGNLLDVDQAYDYFLCSWMGRNGVSGTDRINYQQAIRWTGRGGSGPVRFRSAVDSIPAWHERLRSVTIVQLDAFKMLEKIDDENGAVIYCDPPYLVDTRSHLQHKSSNYVHDFKDEDHVRLAEALKRFKQARVVVSYYDSPRLADLYPDWTKVCYTRHKHLHVQNKRGSKKSEAPEVLLINGPSFEKPSSFLQDDHGLFAEEEE